MKNLKSLALSLVLLIATLGGTTGCGPKASQGPNTNSNPATCGGGYVLSTTYGCLPQASCPAGYGQYVNQCVPATGGYNNSGSCPAGLVFYNGQCVVSVGTVTACAPGCAAGSVQTNYGCLPQFGCGGCSYLSGGICMPGY